MECFNCGNCKQNQPTYYCLARNEFVINQNFVPSCEKVRSGWKKGHPSYEIQRRKHKKSEIEV